jgi:hypothetical protein
MNYDAGNQIPLSWLVRKVPAREIELKIISDIETIRIKAAGKLRRPERKIQSKRQKACELEIAKHQEKWEQRWNEFMLGYEDRDEIWEYSSTIDEWERLMGSSGYVRIRDGKVIKSLMTRMN